MSKNQLQKVPLVEALKQVAELLDALDQGNVPEPQIDELLGIAGKNLSESVDRRVALVQTLTGGKFTVNDDTKGLIGTAKAAIEQWKQRLAALTAALERIKQTTIDALASSPYDFVAGKDGGFKLSQNPYSLEVTIPFREEEKCKKTIYHTISSEDIEYYNIPAQYLIQTLTYSINWETLKKDLSGGADVWKWAKLTRTPRLTLTLKKGDL